MLFDPRRGPHHLLWVPQLWRPRGNVSGTSVLIILINLDDIMSWYFMALKILQFWFVQVSLLLPCGSWTKHPALSLVEEVRIYNYNARSANQNPKKSFLVLLRGPLAHSTYISINQFSLPQIPDPSADGPVCDILCPRDATALYWVRLSQGAIGDDHDDHDDNGDYDLTRLFNKLFPGLLLDHLGPRSSLLLPLLKLLQQVLLIKKEVCSFFLNISTNSIVFLLNGSSSFWINFTNSKSEAVKEKTDEKQEKKVDKKNGVREENKEDKEEKEEKKEKKEEESWEVLSNETNGMSKKTQWSFVDVCHCLNVME